MRHNDIRDLTASLLSEVCCDVGVEPALQPLDHEPLHYATANREDGARLDVVARDFWGQNRQHAFFDVRVFNPFARSYFCLLLSRCYHTHEQEKCRAYDEQIREVERAYMKNHFHHFLDFRFNNNHIIIFTVTDLSHFKVFW